MGVRSEVCRDRKRMMVAEASPFRDRLPWEFRIRATGAWVGVAMVVWGFRGDFHIASGSSGHGAHSWHI